MSFSSQVKEELSLHITGKKHCLLAELAAITAFCGTIVISKDERFSLKFTTENLAVARKCFTLLKKTYNINTEILLRYNPRHGNKVYAIYVQDDVDTKKILKDIKLIDNYNEICENMSLVDGTLIERNCCKRAFIRGAFLSAGSISDPNKGYHFEIVCQTKVQAEQLKDIINTFAKDGAKTVERKKHFVTYLKEGNLIVDILNVMEAHKALMELENIRIVKEIRNSVNRKVNCEAANLNKTVSAAVKQVEDIEYIRDNMGLEKLDKPLYDVAVARLENPQATLAEIGDILSEPIGKSGVNHRLKKLGEIASDLKNRRN